MQLARILTGTEWRGGMLLRVLTALSAAFLLCLPAASAKKERQWQTGTMARIYEAAVDPRDVKQWSKVADLSVADDLVNDTYVIAAGDFLYESQEIRKSGHLPAPFKLNAPVQFAIEKDHVYLTDQLGKEHDTKLIQKVPKAAGSQTGQNAPGAQPQR
jgi:hypothetical protein